MPRMRRPLAALMLCLAAAGAAAQSAAPAPAPAASVRTLATVTVSGVQPGPGLWQVSHGGHVLWVLGTVAALPARMQWRTDEVARTIAASQELIEPPRVRLKADTGFFGKLFLLPSLYGARRNEDGRTLDQVLPPPLYARWLALKRRYLGNDRGIERWRPIFAAHELERQALKQNGLRGAGQIQSAVDALARQHGVPTVATDVTLEIKQPRQAIKAFRAGGPSDITCMARTLDSLEHDLPAETARANAWATGDLAELRALPDSRYRDACIAALTDAGFARQLGIDDVPARVEATWLAAARQALARNRQSFAVLPLDRWLGPDGLAARLQAQGYAVQAPDQDQDAAGDPAAARSVGAPSGPR